jgi:DNA-binding NarL/FixJ family response regulator
MNTPIKIIIADDHEIFRKGFQVLLRKEEEIRIIGEAQNGDELLKLVKTNEPDIVIMDIQMPVMDGIEATRQLTRTHPRIGIIALTMFVDDHLVINMLEAGARGYLLKDTSKSELMEAIHAVYSGNTYFCSATSKKMAHLIGQSRFNLFPARQKTSLTSTEIEIIKLICQEYSSKEIAAQLGYTPRTIENYREKIQEKIGAKNMVGVAVYAIKNRIYTP